MREAEMWYACQMDKGILASGRTLRELKKKLWSTAPQHLCAGHYVCYESSETYRIMIDIVRESGLKRLGYTLDDPRNTFERD